MSKTSRRLKKQRRQVKAKKKKIEQAKIPLVFQVEEASQSIRTAIDSLPKSIYGDLLKTAVSGTLHICRYQVKKKLEEGGKNLTQDIKERLRNRLAAVVEQYDAAVKKVAVPEVLPENCRFVDYREHDSTLYVIEQKPQVRSLFFSDRLRDNKRVQSLEIKPPGYARHKVALPYVIFLVQVIHGQFHQMYAFYRTQPLTSLEDKLLCTNLPNIHLNECSVCVGYDEKFYNSSDPPAKQVHDAVKHFWVSVFNTDLPDRYWQMCDLEPRMKDLRTWVESSVSDPMFVLNVNWSKPVTEFYRDDSLKGILSRVPCSPGGPLSAANIRVQDAVGTCIKETDDILGEVFETIVNDLEYNENAADSAFKLMLNRSVTEATKFAVDMYKSKVEKVLRQAECERQKYLKLVQQEKGISEVLNVQPWPGGNW
jgi:hypothetical protein